MQYPHHVDIVVVDLGVIPHIMLTLNMLDFFMNSIPNPDLAP